MDWIVALILAGFGAILAFKRSTWLVDYLVYVFVFNRGLRRVIDWHAGAFNPFSPVSLVPLLVALAMFVAFIGRANRIHSKHRPIFTALSVAIGYAGVIGLIRIRFAALYAIAEMLAPFAIFGFAYVSRASDSIRDRWIRSFSWAAILASGYGWYQFLTIPPWDSFWLEAVDMVGYMGFPEPTKMTVFSTMGERGVLAGFLGFSIVPMIVSPRWRTVCSWPGVLLVFSIILQTQSRGGVIIAATGTILFLLVNRGANFLQVAIATLVMGGGTYFLFDRLPNAEVVHMRFATLSNMDQDGSYKGRVQIFAASWENILLNPIGYGLGAGGLASRINTGTSASEGVVADAGYLEIAATYGWIGTALLGLGLWRSWKSLQALFKSEVLRSAHVLLARAMMVAMIPACFAGNYLGGISIYWLALGCALSPTRKMLRRLAAQRAKERSRDGAPSALLSA